MTRTRKAAIGAACAAAGLVAVLLVFTFWPYRPPPLPPLPVPNGYDDLLRAGEMVPFTLLDPETATIEELRAFVDDHREALAIARAALARECRVPLEYDPAFLGRQNKAIVVHILRLFDLEAAAAARQGRIGDAVRSSLDLARAASAIRHGGLFFDLIIGDGFESRAMDRLRSLRDRMGPADRQEALSALTAIGREKETFEEVRARDAVFARILSTPIDRLRSRLNSLLGIRDPLEFDVAGTRDRHARHEDDFRRLQAELAEPGR